MKLISLLRGFFCENAFFRLSSNKRIKSSFVLRQNADYFLQKPVSLLAPNTPDWTAQKMPIRLEFRMICSAHQQPRFQSC
jgi:hypothetical protein